MPVAVDGSKFLLADEPEEAMGVIEARESAEDGAPIVVVGRIGGAAVCPVNCCLARVSIGCTTPDVPANGHK